MWLLDTSTAQLHEFIGPERVPGGYAILSHVWERQEQTFNDLRALQTSCAKLGLNPRDHASPKVRQFCELAEKHGHKWGWADMCCIDKSSSAELSEAINSMYRYYSRADVCYAYLCDVPTGVLLDGPPLRQRVIHSDGWEKNAGLSELQIAFARSQWHTRGWTLQELIAPDVVLFVSQEWAIMGAKMDLPNLLHLITSVPRGVLTLVEDPTKHGVAERMKWASFRITTRVEDEAYCLMGIFDVNMPTLYGEGERAFRRLQEEILKKLVDTSLFAWFGEGDDVCPGSAFASSTAPTDEELHEDDDGMFSPTPSLFYRSCSPVTVYQVRILIVVCSTAPRLLLTDAPDEAQVL